MLKHNGQSQLGSLQKGLAHPERAPRLWAPYTFICILCYYLGAGHAGHGRAGGVRGTLEGDLAPWDLGTKLGLVGLQGKCSY